MTKLEENIYNRLLKHEGIDKSTEGNPLTAFLCKAHAKAASEVCKGYIERAFDAGYARFRAEEYGTVPTKAPSKRDWLKSEGITE